MSGMAGADLPGDPQPLSASPARRWLGGAAAVAISAYLLVYLGRRLHPAELVGALRTLPPAGLLGILALYFVLGLLRAMRFRLLLDRRGLPLRVLIPIALLHNLLVRTLPWLTGEISYPALVRRHLGLSISDGVASLVGARIIELLLVLTGGLLGLLSLQGDRFAGDGLMRAAYALAMAAALAGVFLLAPMLHASARILERLGLRSAGSWAAGLAVRVAALWRSRLLLGNLLLSLLIYTTSLSFQLLLLRVCGVQGPLGTQVAVVSLVMLISAIPLSVGGLGIVEGGWTFGLNVLAGVPLPRAVLLAFMLHGVQLLSALLTGLCGWLWLLGQGRDRAR